MAVNGTPITVVGNLTADPELRFTPSGAAVANLTVASTPRTFDKQANEWKDGETTFMRGSVWRDQGENAAASLKRGDRVVATGRLVTRSWETPEGEKRSVMEMEIDEIGASLVYANLQVTKNPKKNHSGNGAQNGAAVQGEKVGANAGGNASAGADPDPF